MVLGVRSLESGVSRAMLPLEALREEPSWSLPASGSCQHPCGGSTPVSISVHITFCSVQSCFLLCLHVFVSHVSYKDTCHWILGHPDNSGWSHLKILNLIISANKVIFTGTRAWTCFFQSHHLTHYVPFCRWSIVVSHILQGYRSLWNQDLSRAVWL